MEVVYRDQWVAVCIKPSGVPSTDEPGGMLELARRALGRGGEGVRTVHRLDQVTGGLMVLALTPEAAGELSRQIREGDFGKEYLAVIHGRPEEPEGTFTDLLVRSRRERRTYVTDQPGPEARPAALDYRLLDSRAGLSLVRVILHTGRTHQIRCQFSSRGFPLVGDRKYGRSEDGCPTALWSAALSFLHPETGERRNFARRPPQTRPWNRFGPGCWGEFSPGPGAEEPFPLHSGRLELFPRQEGERPLAWRVALPGGKTVGQARFSALPGASGQTELSGELFPAFRGRGYALEAAAALAGWALDLPDVRCVAVHVPPEEETAGAALAKAGFSPHCREPGVWLRCREEEEESPQAPGAGVVL